MKRLCLIMFLLFVPAACHDCRQTVLAQNRSSLSDTSLVNKLLELCKHNYRKNPDSSYKISMESYSVSKDINYTKGLAKSLYSLGISKKYLGQFDSAIFFITKAQRYYPEYKDIAGLAFCYSVLGDLFKKKNDYNRAIAYYDSARTIFTELNDSNSISKIYNAIGNMYSSQKQFEKALKYHNQSLEINKQLKFKLGISVNYNNIGNILKKTGDYQKAIDYYNKSLAIKKSIGDSIGFAIALTNIALCYSETGEYQKAIEHQKKALAFFEKIGNKNRIAISLINLGYNYLKNKDYKQALHFATQGLDLSNDIGNKNTITEAYHILSMANAELGNNKKALEQYKLFKAYNDSVSNAEKVMLISEMESKFKIADKERQIATLNAERQKQELEIQKKNIQKSILIGLVIIILIFIIFLYNAFKNRKKLNKELKLLNETKSKFFANLSHEFRTPLTLILGPLEKLNEHMNTGDKELVNTMRRNATRLLFLNNQLLELSRIESGTLKLNVSKGNITDALKGMVMSFQSFAENKNIRYIYSFPGDNLYAYFDIDKLEKIVFNILSNAFKFTQSGGTVTFSASIIKQTSGKKPKTIKTTGDLLKISIIDTGKGIPKESLNQIFNRFYQIDYSHSRGFEGAGLGLSLTKELVEIHHGKLEVTSKVNTGSEFIVYLPLEKTAYDKAEIISHKSESISGSDIQPFINLPNAGIVNRENVRQPDSGQIKNESVLIVEDNDDMRAYISDCLSEYYVILEAPDGNTGFQTAVKEYPDLIITDLMMPGTDGLELCKKIKADERISHIPVIILTALTEVKNKIAGLKTGADDYMAKPFNRKELIARVTNLIRQRETLRLRFKREILLEPEKIAVTSTDEKFLSKIISIIEKEIANPDLTVDLLAQKAALSRSQLHRKIKALTDQSTTQFIRTIRMKRAAQLFRQHYGSIAETVYAVGFNSLSYFTKCFHRQFGISPKDFLSKMQQ